MPISFFVDSCIFIESFKKTGLQQAKDLYSLIFKDFENRYFVSEVVIDEVLFYFIKNKEKFGSLKLKTFAEIFSFFDLLLFEEQLLESWVNLIERYSLKTHDALIVAACKHYDVRYLISLDEGFKRVCE